MKRIVFCFDGTWNRLSTDIPTNVVLTAASIQRQAPGGVTQIIHYDEGVGTGRLEKYSGGMFGAGLVANVREAYRFLVFNYDAGDEIYVFGFSRGAYSARTFVGFLRHVGPLRRLHVRHIDEALKLYQKRLDGADGASEQLRRFRADYSGTVCIDDEDDDWRCRHVAGYTRGMAPRFSVRYLGVWDTVAAIGAPSILPFARLFNRDHAYHDASLTAFVESARHAIAIDERRSLFPPEPWGDLTALNAAKGIAVEHPDALYQEKWFPGTHGSVGGGGDIRGLSDGALNWILHGAKRMGLRLDIDAGSRIHGFKPDPLAPLSNMRDTTFSPMQALSDDREGPKHLWQVSAAAIRRWHAPAGTLPERKPYRPGTLRQVADLLEAHPAAHPAADGAGHTIHVVVSGDALSGLAKFYYKDASRWQTIFDANRDVLDHPDEIFVGQPLRIPAAPAGG